MMVRLSLVPNDTEVALLLQINSLVFFSLQTEECYMPGNEAG